MLQKSFKDTWITSGVTSDCPFAFSSWTRCPLEQLMTRINISSSLIHRHLRRPLGWRHGIRGWRWRTCASHLSPVACVRLMWPLCSCVCVSQSQTAHLGNKCCSVYKVALNTNKALTLGQDGCPHQQCLLPLVCRKGFIRLFPEDMNHQEDLCPLSLSWGHWPSCKVSLAIGTVG